MHLRRVLVGAVAFAALLGGVSMVGAAIVLVEAPPSSAPLVPDATPERTAAPSPPEEPRPTAEPTPTPRRTPRIVLPSVELPTIEPPEPTLDLPSLPVNLPSLPL